MKKHPVVEAVHMAGYGGSRGLSSPAELDALGLPAAHRAKVRDACVDLAARHDRGENVWARADEAAAKLVAELPEEFQRADYLDGHDRVNLARMTPSELANLVPRSLS